MMNTELIVVKGKVIEQKKNFSEEVGEDIGYEAGAKMIKAYYDENPDDVLAYFMGRNQIEAILAQPGVVGIRIFNGINSMGIKQLVLVGADKNRNNVLNYSTVNEKGEIIKRNGIVADRAMMCPPYCGDNNDGVGDGTIGW